MSNTEHASVKFSPEIEAKLSKANSKAGRLQREVLRVLVEHRNDGALPTSGRFIFYELEGRGVVLGCTLSRTAAARRAPWPRTWPTRCITSGRRELSPGAGW